MKKTTLLLAGLAGLALAPLASADVIAYENFTGYTADVFMKDQGVYGNGYGWTGNWASTLLNGPYLRERTPSFAFASGNMVEGSAGRINRSLTAPVTSGEVWMSTVFELAPATTGSFQLTLYSDDASAHMGGFRLNSGVWEYHDTAITQNTTNDPYYLDHWTAFSGSSGVTSGEFLLVMGVDLDALTVNYYIFDSSTTNFRDPGQAALTVATTIDAEYPGNVGALGIAPFGGGAYYGNIVVGEDFQDVVPEPSTYAALAGALALLVALRRKRQ